MTTTLFASIVQEARAEGGSVLLDDLMRRGRPAVTLQWAAQWPELAPGVHGDVQVSRDGVTFILFLASIDEGHGNVARWLDSLTGTIVVRAVLSARLAGMLERRGFRYDPATNDWARP